MELVVLAIVFVYTAILWVTVLLIYSTLIESFDFGHVPTFAAKSVALCMIVAVIGTFVPFGGLLNLLVWWLGMVILFRMDFWESRILVVLLWVVNFLVGLALRGLLMSMVQGSA